MSKHCPPVFTSLYAFVESGVNVFDENKAALRRVGQEMIQLVVCQTSFGKIEYADVISQRPSQCLYKRGFS